MTGWFGNCSFLLQLRQNIVNILLEKLFQTVGLANLIWLPTACLFVSSLSISRPGFESNWLLELNQLYACSVILFNLCIAYWSVSLFLYDLALFEELATSLTCSGQLWSIDVWLGILDFVEFVFFIVDMDFFLSFFLSFIHSSFFCVLCNDFFSHCHSFCCMDGHCASTYRYTARPSGQ